MMWIGIVWLSCYAVGGLWFWCLHNKKELIGEYPYDDDM